MGGSSEEAFDVTRRLPWIVAITVAFSSGERRVSGQCSDWVQRTSTFRPIFRTSGKMCFDSVRGLTMLYAINSDANPDVMENWFWSGSNWSRLDSANRPPGPEGWLDQYALAFDSRRNVVVLFGGRDSSNILDDTWEFDGQNWKLVATSGPPISAAQSPQMVFDSDRGVIVLMRWNAGMILWEWNGVTWTQRNPTVSPPIRYGFGACFDTVRGVTLVFGGESSSPPDLNDTWEWNGIEWTQRFPTNSPTGRRHASMAFDSVRGKAVLFGGEISGGADLGDTWEWDGNDWTEISPTVSPPARADYATAFDSNRGKTVIFWQGE